MSVCIWFQEFSQLGHLAFVSVFRKVPQLRLVTAQLFLNFCETFFPEWPLIFSVIMIHKVICEVLVEIQLYLIFSVHSSHFSMDFSILRAAESELGQFHLQIVKYGGARRLLQRSGFVNLMSVRFHVSFLHGHPCRCVYLYIYADMYLFQH